jgi:hypothetical protein
MNRLTKSGLEMAIGTYLLCASSNIMDNNAYALPINNSAHTVIRNGALASASRHSTTNSPKLSEEEEAFQSKVLNIYLGALAASLAGIGLYFRFGYKL